MNTLRKIQTAASVSLIAAIGLLCGVASGDPPILPPPPPDQPGFDPAPFPDREGAILCTMSGPTATGRNWAETYLTRQPGICCRKRLFGTAPSLFPSCHQMARTQLACTIVIDCD